MALDDLVERVMVGIREHVHADIDDFELSATAIRAIVRSALSEAKELGATVAQEYPP